MKELTDNRKTLTDLRNCKRNPMAEFKIQTKLFGIDGQIHCGRFLWLQHLSETFCTLFNMYFLHSFITDFFKTSYFKSQ
jgi:hypothetical protein